jgi:hypothetical protein
MLFNPAIMALIMVSVIVSAMLLIAAGFSIQVLRGWDINSGSESQLSLERRTYLISTLLTWVFASELVSLMLFIYNAESMSGQFVGAMCATGVLNVNAWGWPTLFLKIMVFFTGAVWLAVNYLDNQGFDYPLIKTKYWLLLLIVPLVLLESFVQLRYFLGLNPDVITSCCGALFSTDAEGVAAEISGLPPATALPLLYGTGLIMMLSGTWLLLRRNGGLFFAASGGVAFVAALVGIVSVVSLYIYEHPHHHCPFCILKPGHDHAGYALYIPLFTATALAFASGVMGIWREIPSLTDVVEREVPRLAWISMSLFVLFFAVATAAVWRSNLIMESVWW